MKKLLLLALVVLGGVMKLEAKQVRFFVQDPILNTANHGVYIYVYDTNNNALAGEWPGTAMALLGTVNGVKWYEAVINISDSKVSALKWVINNYMDNWGNGGKTADMPGALDCSLNEYTSVITTTQDANGCRPISNSITKYYLYDISAASASELTINEDGVYEGVLNTSSSKTYLIAPSYTLNDGVVTYVNDNENYWNFVYRPTSETQTLWEFQNYNGTATTTNSDQNWSCTLLNIPFSVTFNSVDKSYSFNPYIPVTISPLGYATFSSNYDVAVDGATATYITGVGANNVLEEEPFTDGIKANTGALLHKAGGGEVTFTPAASTPTDVSSTNKLVAVSSNISALDQTSSNGNTNYILTNQTVNGEKAIGFYKANSGANGQTKNSVAAGKAYLSLPSSMAVSREFFWLGGEDATSINAIEKVAQNVEGYFNLNGQRIAQPNKGLYIVNGKKVIIK